MWNIMWGGVCLNSSLHVPVTSVTSNLIKNFVLITADQSVKWLGCRLDDSHSVLVGFGLFFLPQCPALLCSTPCLLPSNAEVENAWNFTSTLVICLHEVVLTHIDNWLLNVTEGGRMLCGSEWAESEWCSKVCLFVCLFWKSLSVVMFQDLTKKWSDVRQLVPQRDQTLQAELRKQQSILV